MNSKFPNFILGRKERFPMFSLRDKKGAMMESIHFGRKKNIPYGQKVRSRKLVGIMGHSHQPSNVTATTNLCFLCKCLSVVVYFHQKKKN